MTRMSALIAVALVLFVHGAAADTNGTALLKPPFPRGFVPPKPLGFVVPHIPILPHYDITACLMLDIGADGSTSNITVTHSTGVAFYDAAIVEMYSRRIYTPASVGGVPVAIQWQSRYTLQIKGFLGNQNHQDPTTIPCTGAP